MLELHLISHFSADRRDAATSRGETCPRRIAENLWEDDATAPGAHGGDVGVGLKAVGGVVAAIGGEITEAEANRDGLKDGILGCVKSSP